MKIIAAGTAEIIDDLVFHNEPDIKYGRVRRSPNLLELNLS